MFDRQTEKDTNLQNSTQTYKHIFTIDKQTVHMKE